MTEEEIKSFILTNCHNVIFTAGQYYQEHQKDIYIMEFIRKLQIDIDHLKHFNRRIEEKCIEYCELFMKEHSNSPPYLCPNCHGTGYIRTVHEIKECHSCKGKGILWRDN